jgi:glycosyltransferase involved in cell wall biosynthesis
VKRVLIISWYFPPAGGSAVQRILAMTRHLPACGWECVILTADPESASWPTTDPGLVRRLPENLEVHRIAGPDPYVPYRRWTGRSPSIGFADGRAPGLRERVARWIRANLFLPDARVGWSRRAGRMAGDLVRSRGIDVVLTSGPPHSAHLAGLGASRATGCPQVVDLRDSWPDPAYRHQLPTTRAARRRDERMRGNVLRHASEIVVVSAPMARELPPVGDVPVRVIGNGYEDDDFREAERVRHEGFELLHAGNLPPERNPEALWTAIAGLRDSGRIPGLRVRLLGRVDRRVLDSVRARGLEAVVTAEESRPHDEAIARMISADALLLSVNRVPGAEGIVTGKVYEYVASGRPVIGIGPKGGEAEHVLARSGAGRMFDFEDHEGVRAYLRTLYDAWAAGEPVRGASAESAAPFSRRTRTRELADVLDRVAAGVGPG